jgi:tetratricopeptide (TPR) repeat protein
MATELASDPTVYSSNSQVLQHDNHATEPDPLQCHNHLEQSSHEEETHREETNSPLLTNDNDDTGFVTQSNISFEAINQEQDSTMNPPNCDSQPEQLTPDSTDSVDINKQQSDDRQVTLKSHEWENVLDEAGTEGLVQKRIIRVGDSSVKLAEAGDLLKIRILVRNAATQELIASECHDQLSLIVGDFDTLGGVYLGATKMHKGELAELLINPDFAYGSEGRLPHVPGSCRLHCEIEVLDICPIEFGKNVTFEQRFELIKAKKDKGNFWFGCDRVQPALLSYQRALEMLDTQYQELVTRDDLIKHKLSTISSSSDAAEAMNQERDNINSISSILLSLRVTCLNNAAACYMKMQMFAAALEAVNFALLIDDTNVKALFRKGKILTEMFETDEAIECMRVAAKLEPDNKAVLRELIRLQAKAKLQRQDERKMYQKMLQNEPIKSVGKSTDSIDTQSSKRWSYQEYCSAALLLAGVTAGGFFLYRKYQK